MNNTDIFNQAHRLTKETLKSQDGNYAATLGLCLKAIYAGIKAKKESLRKEAQFQIDRFPAVFKKPASEVVAKFVDSKYFVQDITSEIIKSITHIANRNKQAEKEAAAYYKRVGSVTMC